MEQILMWLKNWFLENSNVEENDFNYESDYIEAGWIDSFEFLSLIDSVECKYNVLLEESDFENRKVFTIGGLAAVIFDRH